MQDSMWMIRHRISAFGFFIPGLSSSASNPPKIRLFPAGKRCSRS